VLVFVPRRLILALTIATAVVATVARPARAATVPNGDVVRVGRSIDVAAFARAVTSRYHVVLRRVVATDIDRDGDVDVLASTDFGFVVWLNDGAGRLTSQTPRHRPLIASGVPDRTWDDGAPRDEETIQNEAPSSRVTGEYVHASPSPVGQPALSADAPLPPDTSRGTRTPRAPPHVASC